MRIDQRCGDIGIERTGDAQRFVDALLQRGRIRAMDTILAPFEVEPLRETARVAVEARSRLNAPGRDALAFL